MGCFSWNFCNRKGAMVIGDEQDACFLIPKEFVKHYGAEYIYQNWYDGYGMFGEYDVYVEVAKWNREYLKEIYERMSDDELVFASVSDIEAFMKGRLDDEEKIRNIGIDIACGNEQNCILPYPIKIASRPCDYKNCYPSLTDPNQGCMEKMSPSSVKVYDAMRKGQYEPYNNRILPYSERKKQNEKSEKCEYER